MPDAVIQSYLVIFCLCFLFQIHVVQTEFHVCYKFTLVHFNPFLCIQNRDFLFKVFRFPCFAVFCKIINQMNFSVSTENLIKPVIPPLVHAGDQFLLFADVQMDSF